MKTLYSLLLMLFLSLIAVSCKKKSDSKNNQTDVSNQEIDKTIYLFMSKDSTCQFEYQNTSDGIIIHDLVKDTTYLMVQSPSGSGAKFTDQTGHSFWNKGNDFMWLLQDSLLCEGSMVE